MKVSKLKKNPGNPRQIKGEKLELLKKSVGSFQKMMELRPMIVDEDFVVLGGNMRLAAIKALGLKEIPDTWVRQVTDLTDDEKKEFIIKDNNSFGEYDWDAIANEWSDLPLADWGLDVPGFEAIDEPEGDADAEPQIDKAAELNKKWKVKSGDLWQIGEHRLLCGDSKSEWDIQKFGKVDFCLCLTDPPYGQNQEGVTHDDPEGLHELIELSTAAIPITNGLIVAFQSPRTFPVMLDAVRANGYHFERMLWLYKAAQCTFPWRGWILTSESILVASKGDAQWQEVHPFSHDCYYLSEVSGELAPDSGWHGSVKPLTVVKDLLSRTSPVGGNVYEPFAGSGTTLVACQNLNRKCYAIEISENYCAVILERMQAAFPDIEIKRIENAKTKGTN